MEVLTDVILMLVVRMNMPTFLVMMRESSLMLVVMHRAVLVSVRDMMLAMTTMLVAMAVTVTVMFVRMLSHLSSPKN